jgi:hypothetical protein
VAERDPAIARLWLLTGVRLVALALVLAGLWLAADGRPLAGIVPALGGLALFVLLPRRLLKRWRG